MGGGKTECPGGLFIFSFLFSSLGWEFYCSEAHNTMGVKLSTKQKRVYLQFVGVLIGGCRSAFLYLCLPSTLGTAGSKGHVRLQLLGGTVACGHGATRSEEARDDKGKSRELSSWMYLYSKFIGSLGKTTVAQREIRPKGHEHCVQGLMNGGGNKGRG